MSLRISFLSLLMLSQLTPLVAQIFEHHEDLSYRNKYTDVVNLGDSVWVVSGNYNIMSSFFSGAYLKAFDTSGTELWNTGSLGSAEYQSYNELELLPNGNLVAFGVKQECCDCSMPFLQMLWHSSEGELLNQVNFESIDFFGEEMVVCQTESLLGFAYEQNWPAQSHVLATSSSGDSLWVTELGEVSIKHLISDNGNFVAIGDSVLFRIDETGLVLDSTDYSSPPIDACSAFNHKPFIMWNEGVYEVLENGTLSLVIPNIMDSSAVELFSGDDRLFVRYHDVIMQYNSDFELTMTTPYNALPHWEQGSTASNQSTFAMVGARHIHTPNFHSYRGAAIQTIGISGNQLEHFPDLAISSVYSTLEVQEADVPSDNVFVVSGDFTGYLVNEGNVDINSAFVNYLSGYALCNRAGNRELVTNMGLAPGDSMLFTISNIQEIVGIAGDSTAIEFCLFLSDPSNYYDRNGENDEVCFTQTIYVGLPKNEFEIVSAYPNPANERIRFEVSKEAKSGQLQVFDHAGKVTIERGFVGVNSLEVSVSSLRSGLYFARIVTDGKASLPIKFAVVR